MPGSAARWRRGLLGAALAGIVLLAQAIGAAGRPETTVAHDGTTAGDLAVATFAGGCFWCMEPPYDEIDGVIATIAGYIGGHVDAPSYEQVSSGTTGHAEAVQITYDPARIHYEDLLKIFWRNVDPTTPDRQFCDHGSQYRPAIFYHDEQQKKLALESLEAVEGSKPFKDPIRTQIVAATAFFEAEDYHQDYYLKNPVRYKFYRYNCGRDRRLRQLWGSDT